MGRFGGWYWVAAFETLNHRHAELVSASIAPQSQPARFARWTLKQVQGDGGWAVVRRGDFQSSSSFPMVKSVLHSEHFCSDQGSARPILGTDPMRGKLPNFRTKTFLPQFGHLKNNCPSIAKKIAPKNENEKTSKVILTN